MNLNELIHHAASLQDRLVESQAGVAEIKDKIAQGEAKLEELRAVRDIALEKYRLAKQEIKALLAAE